MMQEQSIHYASSYWHPTPLRYTTAYIPKFFVFNEAVFWAELSWEAFGDMCFSDLYTVKIYSRIGFGLLYLWLQNSLWFCLLMKPSSSEVAWGVGTSQIMLLEYDSSCHRFSLLSSRVKPVQKVAGSFCHEEHLYFNWTSPAGILPTNQTLRNTYWIESTSYQH